MFRWIQQKQFHVDDAQNLIGRIGVDRDAAITIFLQAINRFVIRQIIRQHKTVDARRHAVLCGFISDLDDFLDDFGFSFVQSAFLFTHLKQCL